MAAVAGFTGVVTIGATPAIVMNITKFGYNGSRNLLDVTALNNSTGSKAFIAGLKEHVANIEGNYDSTDTTGQLAFWNAFSTGTLTQIQLKTAASGTNTVFSGSFFVDKIKIEDNVNGLVTFMVDVKFSGDVTLA